MCGFGIHMEKRPHRFDLLYEKNPKEWDYLMFHMCKDESGNDYGWAKVLDYIGVENGRTRVEWVSAAEGVKFSQTMNEFVEKIHSLGKNVRLEDLRCRS